MCPVSESENFTVRGVEKAVALTNTAACLRATLLRLAHRQHCARRHRAVLEQPRTVYEICSEAWCDADNCRISIQLICINENSAQEYAHLGVSVNCVMRIKI